MNLILSLVVLANWECWIKLQTLLLKVSHKKNDKTIKLNLANFVPNRSKDGLFGNDQKFYKMAKNIHFSYF